MPQRFTEPEIYTITLCHLTTRGLLQEKYGFKARTYNAAGFADVAEYKKVHGSDLFITDIEEYDKICKVRASHSLT